MHPYFDLSRVKLLPLKDRVSDLKQGFIRPLEPVRTPLAPELEHFAHALRAARHKGRSRIWMMGAHVLRAGLQHYLFSLMEDGFISGIALNGAGAIHDFELALHGETTESVALYITDGKFGHWQETGSINAIVKEGWEQDLGFGEALGKAIHEQKLPFRHQSVFAHAYTLGIPVTVHVSLGYDIIHTHQNFDPAATGAASHRDFLIFAKILENLEGGCAATFGSAVMAPEIFLKALSAVRNVATQQGRSVRNFHSLVCDLHDLPESIASTPPKEDALYYFRPWKSLLARTVADGGQGLYVQGRHEETLPALWTALHNA